MPLARPRPFRSSYPGRRRRLDRHRAAGARTGSDSECAQPLADRPCARAKNESAAALRGPLRRSHARHLVPPRLPSPCHRRRWSPSTPRGGQAVGECLGGIDGFGALGHARERVMVGCKGPGILFSRRGRSCVLCLGTRGREGAGETGEGEKAKEGQLHGASAGETALLIAGNKGRRKAKAKVHG